MRRIGAVVVACVALAACNGDSGSRSEPAPQGDSLRVTPRLSEVTSDQAATLDLDLAREQLGLPDDADPAYVSGESLESLDPERRRLKSAFHTVVGGTLSGLGRSSARLRDAIDLSQVSETASVVTRQPAEETVVLRTTQPFDEVAVALDDAGYERDRKLLVDEHADAAIESVYVADAGDGAILLTESRSRAETAAAGEASIGAGMLDLLDETEGPLRLALEPTRPLGHTGCVTAVAVGEDVGPPYAGEIVLRVDGTPSLDEFLPLDPGDGPAAERLVTLIEFGTPDAGDGIVTVPFRFVTDPHPDRTAIGSVFAAIRAGVLDGDEGCG